ncbi:AMP binding enzyme [Rhizoctonia solani]|uniref:AMP binding enzyme n=1 Tax=Rhizoctonia solani TaxID=456999 RepID=A0A8H8NY19_9AGAM|nr:AMP binding enzyme [Rhizoctonia solani]QRW20451.1 AMP binding enzyme [Rhizoctonia solani]
MFHAEDADVQLPPLSSPPIREKEKQVSGTVSTLSYYFGATVEDLGKDLAMYQDVPDDGTEMTKIIEDRDQRDSESHLPTRRTRLRTAHQLKDSGASHVFVHPALLGTLFKAFEILNVPANDAQKRVVIMSYGTLPIQGTEKFTQLDSLLRAGKLAAEEGSMESSATRLSICVTRLGPPGSPRTTHHNMNTVLTICRPAFPGMIPAMLGILPFYHIYGCVKLVHYPFTVGVPVVISPPFNPDEFCSYIQKYKISGALIVPPVWSSWHHTRQSINTTSPRFVSSFQAPRPSEQNSKPASNNVFTSPTCTLLPLQWAEQKVGSAGELLPNLEARLVTEDGTDAKEGEPGEFWLRGPSVMKGYFNNPTATANAITPDGWFKTGDIAVRDKEGFFTIVDRLKELIKYKGFQVPPADLENVLLTHPDIVDVGVIGVHSEEQATELPRAYVVHRAGYNSFKSQAERDAFGKQVEAWIQTRVAKHKFLRGGVSVIEAIPKSAAGKILRRQLRDLAKKELDVVRPKAKL